MAYRFGGCGGNATRATLLSIEVTATVHRSRPGDASMGATTFRWSNKILISAAPAKPATMGPSPQDAADAILANKNPEFLLYIIEGQRFGDAAGV